MLKVYRTLLGKFQLFEVQTNHSYNLAGYKIIPKEMSLINHRIGHESKWKTGQYKIKKTIFIFFNA